MSIEQRGGLFSREEIHNEDNCVFFAADDYLRDKFGVELTRNDFDRFIKRKRPNKFGSGIPLPVIAKTLDYFLEPHNIGVSEILFQIGVREHYSRQLTIKDPNNLRNPKIWLEMQLFLKDKRIKETQEWTYPFMALLTSTGGIAHLEYIGNIENFNVALEKVGGDKGGIPIGFKLAQINS